MKKLILLPLVASAMLAGCAVYPSEPAVGVDVGIGWHGDRYWDGQRYWDRGEWEHAHPQPQYYRRDDGRRDNRGGYRGDDRRDGDRRGDDNRPY
ncbi:hypothetical protein [Burkholderia oklahomensis]|uniref:hypothetical protein n=1 Tax=Burkholderia oklahomensis TaxID=342113 RepID=UPI000474417B|nr:hypothetical protein [Burkholderia oklahomensis]AJX32508.1 hypothetical protein BG90_3307 [Burkholderia oklahomensis C6786]AOI45916.1 hypothetical protein WI23_09025 [Burkholderia oklahomensis C6786]KUY52904.1 hypothetical protein WI23_23885 [Burkholderia oklahomensis C6786]MBI0361538.1 hypothetical protein [Burkholderia oklahomensis]SUW55601.1 Uncharacterised protein [Burkholderia oklahomensis]